MYSFNILKIRNFLKDNHINVSELAEKTGIKRATLYNYLNENTPITVEALVSILNICDLSIAELLGNSNISESSMQTSVASSDNKEENKTKKVTLSNAFLLKTDSTKEHQVIPLYNMKASAGLVQLLDNMKNQAPIDFISIPNLPNCDGALFVTGDSMYPLLKSGDIIVYKQIEDIENDIFWGEMYLISVDVGGEELVTIKYVQKSEKEGYIKLVSQNKHHQDKDVKISKIRAMAIIKASIRYNSMS